VTVLTATWSIPARGWAEPDTLRTQQVEQQPGAGLEELKGRLNPFRQAFLSTAAVLLGAVVSLPTPPAQTAQPPVPKPAASNFMEQSWAAKFREMQGTLLADQTRQQLPKIKLIQAQAVQADRARARNLITFEEHQRQMVALEQVPVITTQGVVLEMLSEYLKAQGGGRPADWDTFQKTVGQQVDAQEKYLRAKDNFLVWRARSYRRLNQERIGGWPLVAGEDADLAEADAASGRIELEEMGIIRRLYDDLKLLGLTQPPLLPPNVDIPGLPSWSPRTPDVGRIPSGRVGIDKGISRPAAMLPAPRALGLPGGMMVQVPEDPIFREAFAAVPRDVLGSLPRPMTGMQWVPQKLVNRQLTASVRGHIRDLLGMEGKKLEVGIGIRELVHQQMAAAYRQRVATKSQMEQAEFLLASTEPKKALLGVLSAQQNLVVANGPEAIEQAQKGLNQAVTRHTQTLIELGGSRRDFLRGEYQRAVESGKVGGLNVVPDGDRFQSSIAMQRSVVQEKFLKLHQQLDKELQRFGASAGLLDATASFAGVIDIQSMVQPVLIGLPKVPGTPEEIQGWARAVRAARSSLFDTQIEDIDLQIQGLADYVKRTEEGYQRTIRGRPTVPEFEYQSAQDSRKQIEALEKLKVLRRAQQKVEQAETQQAFKTAVDQYEDALVGWVAADRAAVQRRWRTLADQASAMRTATIARPTQGDIDIVQAQADVMHGRLLELETLLQIYRTMKGKAPLVDPSRGASSAGTMASPDTVQLLLEQVEQGAQPRIGVVSVAGRPGEMRLALVGGEQWMYLAGPPVLGDFNPWGVQPVEFSQIPAGRPGEGNVVMKEYLQPLRVDLGSVIGSQNPRSIGAEVLVYGFSPMSYQGVSGFRRVVALKDSPVIDPRGFRVGTTIQTDPKTGQPEFRRNPEGETRPVPGGQGFVGASSYEFRWTALPGGGGRYEKSVTGLTGWTIPLTEYEAKGKDVPIAPGAVSRTPDGMVIFGTNYHAGRQTVGPKGHARYGVLDEAGDRLPPMFVQTEAGEIWAVPEVRRVFNEETEQWVLTFHYHPVQSPAGEGRQEQPPAPVVEPAPAPAEKPVVEEPDEGISWGWWAAGALVAGAGALVVWKLRHRQDASAFVRTFSEKYGLPVIGEGAVVPEYHVVAVSPSSVKDQKNLIGLRFRIGNGELVVVPEESEPIQQILQAWMSHGRVVVEGYRSGETDEPMRLFGMLAETMGYSLTWNELNDLTRLDLLKRLLANLIGQKAETIPESELIQLEQALSVLA